MKRWILFFAMVMPMWLAAQVLSSFTHQVPNGYNFWVYTPAGCDSAEVQKPIVLFLHGQSLCGSDLNRVRKYGPLDALNMGRKIDAVVVAPQNPGGSWNPAKIMSVIEWVEARYPVDTNRLYVLGMSLRGYGTIHFVAAYPNKVAAAMALCGGSNLTDHCPLCEVPLWILHGTADKAIAFSQSQKIVNAMKACGDTSRLRFTKLPGQSHGALAKIFYLEDTYEWLFAHRLTDSARAVSHNVDISVSTMSKAYTNIDRSKQHFTVVNGNRNVPEASDTTALSADTLAQNADGQNVTQSQETNSQPKQSTSSPQYYKVRKGDTLSSIARKYHTTVKKLCKLNKIKETTILQIGRKLRVK